MSEIKIIVLKNKTEISRCSLPHGNMASIGRIGSGSVIEIDYSAISRKQAYIIYINNKVFIRDTNSTNGTYINGTRIKPDKDVLVNNDDIVSFCSNSIISLKIVKDNFQIKYNEAQIEEQRSLGDWLSLKDSVLIGRSHEADIVLVNDKSVSRKHAEVSRIGNKYYISDLESTNGTYVNGERIFKKTEITEKDSIFIGLNRFKINEQQKDLSKENAITACGVIKYYNAGQTNKEPVGLHEISFSIPNKEFVALMGPSGCGKSTLLKALNGDNPATSGTIYIHGLELTENYDYLKRKIGYVPQDDIVHRELSVDKSLYYAAKLRMGDNVSEKIISQKIDEVLSNLNINRPDIRTKKVGELSGGQRKRVSIAVELLNNPSILFLDEPTSPLDPETIEEFLKCIKSLAENGTTIVMVTHKPEDLNYVDKVILLTTKGYHAYYGEKGEKLFQYFNCNNIIGIYSKLSNEDEIKKWYEKWNTSCTNTHQVKTSSKPRKTISESLIRQYYWLSSRYLNIKLNDKGNMLLLLAQPVIIASLLIVIFDKLQLGVLFLMAISAVWFGVSNAAKEIVSEIPIYKRERMFNLNINTYIFSKITILSFIAFVQVLIFILIVYFKYQGSGSEIHLVNVSTFFFYMFYLAVSATLIGLLLSAVFTNTEKVMTFVPIALMPQIMLAGVVTRIDNQFKEVLSYFTLGRWGTEGFCRIQDNYNNFHLTETLLVNKRIDTLFTNNHGIKVPESFSVDYDHITEIKIKSLYTTVPKTADTLVITQNNDTTFYTYNEIIETKTGALNQLGFYDTNGKLLEIFNSFDNNLIVISLLNIIVFIGIFIALKKKDSL